MRPRCQAAHLRPAGRIHCARSRLSVRTPAAAVQDADVSVDVDTAKLRPVEKVVSARVTFDDQGEPTVQYLAKWKEDNDMTWEPTENLSEDLVRDFEEAFWQACRIGDLTFLNEALKWGGETLANLVNSEGRSPLHLASALNHQMAVQRILEAGADVDVQDPEGYTPLHMASGYLHVETVGELLKAGADITRSDKAGRDVRTLVDSLRERMTSANAIQNRMRLESVAKALMYHLYEDVAPAAVLRKRKPAIGDDGPTMYLVRYRDGTEDSWLPAEFLSAEVIEDFENGMEYAEAECILDVRDAADCEREYLVRWKDGQADSWESEDCISSAIVSAFEAERKEGTPDDAAPETDATAEKQPAAAGVR